MKHDVLKNTKVYHRFLEVKLKIKKQRRVYRNMFKKSKYAFPYFQYTYKIVK